MRRSKRTAIGLVGVLGLTALGGIGATAAMADTTPHVASAAADDTELLRGILFASGPVAQQIGLEAEELGLEVPENFDELADEVLAAYVEDESGVIDTALSDIRSDDILRVEAGLVELTEDFGTWVRGYADEQGMTISAAGDVSPQAAVCVWNVCVGNAVLGINLAVAVTVAFVTFVITDAESAGVDISNEQYVSRLSDAASAA